MRTQWEILATLRAPTCRFEVLLTQAQRAAFELTLRQDFTSIVDALSAIDTRRAVAGKQADKDMIDAAVLKTTGGYVRVNGRIQAELRDWLVQRGMDALAQLQAGAADGKGSADMPVAQLQSRVGCLLLEMGRTAEAAPLLEAALQSDPDNVTTQANLAGLRIKQGLWADAETMLTCLHRKQLGATDAETLNVMKLLSTVLHLTGRVDEAAALAEEVLKVSRATLTDGHHSTLVALSNLAALRRAQRNWSEAEKLYRQAAAACQALHGERHPMTLTCIGSPGGVLVSQQRLEDAQPFCIAAESGFREVLGDEHPDTLVSITELAQLRLAQGKPDVALPLFEEALRGSRAQLGNSHAHTLIAMHNAACTLEKLSRFAEAEALFAEALGVQRTALSSTHADTMKTMHSLARPSYAFNGSRPGLSAPRPGPTARSCGAGGRGARRAPRGASRRAPGHAGVAAIAGGGAAGSRRRRRGAAAARAAGGAERCAWRRSRGHAGHGAVPAAPAAARDTRARGGGVRRCGGGATAAARCA